MQSAESSRCLGDAEFWDQADGADEAGFQTAEPAPVDKAATRMQCDHTDIMSMVGRRKKGVDEATSEKAPSLSHRSLPSPNVFSSPGSSDKVIDQTAASSWEDPDRVEHRTRIFVPPEVICGLVSRSCFSQIGLPIRNSYLASMY